MTGKPLDYSQLTSKQRQAVRLAVGGTIDTDQIAGATGAALVRSGWFVRVQPAGGYYAMAYSLTQAGREAYAAAEPAGVPAAANAPVLCLNCGKPANRGDFALCWDCEYDFRSAASAPICPICGNYPVLDGYRVCASCKEAREYAPYLWADQPPDKLEAEPPPAPEADETTDELLHIIHKEYGIRADKLILEREELAAQLADSRERERDLRAALEACKELLPELDLFYNWKVSQATGDNLPLWDAKRSKLDEVLKRIASEETSDGR